MCIERKEFDQFKDQVKNEVRECFAEIKKDTEEIRRLIKEQNGRVGRCESAIKGIENKSDFHDRLHKLEKETREATCTKTDEIQDIRDFVLEVKTREATCLKIDEIQNIKDYILESKTREQTTEKNNRKTMNHIAMISTIGTILMVIIGLITFFGS